ncbi:MAG: hypothetical protein IJL52_10560 [Clostridia bacterium]|nr:hypothetical protein [Clostridia bacterium]
MTTGLALLLAGWWAVPLSLLQVILEHLGQAGPAAQVGALMMTLIERGSDTLPSAVNALGLMQGGAQLFGLLETLADRGGAVMITLLSALGLVG